MGSHVHHPETLTHGLADDCPECAKKAKAPLRSLDRPHLTEFWLVMLEVERGYRTPERISAGMRVEHYRSGAERAVCYRLAEYAEFLQVLGIDPTRERLGALVHKCGPSLREVLTDPSIRTTPV